MRDINKIDIDSFAMPKYLRDDVEALIKGVNNKVNYVDCLQNEVYSSINIAMYACEITEERAEYLRDNFTRVNWVYISREGEKNE